MWASAFDAEITSNDPVRNPRETVLERLRRELSLSRDQVATFASWDVFNHHYYIPFAWMTGRIDADFFGAGPQSYQNPLGYLPFYARVRTGAPDWLVGMALTLQAAIHFAPTGESASSSTTTASRCARSHSGPVSTFFAM